MGLPDPCFLLSFKTYPGTAGQTGAALARELEAAADEADADIELALAPQTPDLRLVANATTGPIVAQAVDAAEPGSETGDVLVETVAEAGANAAFVNHPEHEQSLGTIREIVKQCDATGMDAIVCVRSVAEGLAAVDLGADWLLFEKPSDIASGEPLVRRHPDRVRSFVEAVRDRDPDVRVAVGGGISSAGDVEAAFDCGVDGVGAASAVVTADDPPAALRDLLEGA